MEKSSKKFRSQVFVKYIMLFLTSSLIILLGAIVPFYVFSVRHMKNMIQDSNYRTYKFISNTIDRKLNDIGQEILSLSTNDAIYQFSGSWIDSAAFSPEVLTTIHRVIDAVTDYANINPLISELVVYSEKNQYSISSNGQPKLIDTPSLLPWYEGTRPDKLGKWFCLETARQNTADIYLVRKSMPFSTYNHGFLATRISLQNLLSYLSIGEDFQTKICLFDEEGQTIYSDPSFTLEERQYIHENRGGERLETSNYILSGYTLPYSGFRCIIATSLSDTMEPVYHMGTFAIGLSLFVLLLGFFISYKFSLVSYRPIRNAAALLESTTDHLSNAPRKNEFEIISNATQELKSNISSLQTTIQHNHESIKIRFLQNLINGYHYDEKQIENLLSVIDTTFTDDYFCVCSILIDNYGILSKENSYYDISIIKYALLNILEETLNAECRSLSYDDKENQMVLLANLPSPDPEKALAALLESYISYVKSRFSISLTICMGLPQERLSNADISYRQSLLAGNEHFLHGGERVIIYRPEMSELNYGPIQARINTEKIVNLAVTGNFAQLEEEFTGFITCIQSAGNYSRESVILHLLNTTASVFHELDRQNSGTSLFPDFHKELVSLPTLAEYTPWILKLLAHCTVEPDTSETAKSSKYIHEMVEYIDSHFTDELSLDVLADLFGLSKTYVSTLLNRQLGMSLTSYINMLRINTAKKLLVEQPFAKIQDISMQVGFNNQHTFLRAFKKEEGITPAQYRSHAKKSD